MSNNLPSYKIWWDEKEKIGRIVFYGDPTEEMALKFKQDALKLLQEIKAEKINCLVDISKAGVSLSRTRAVFSDAMKHPSLNKVAILGANVVTKLITDFVISMAGKKNTQYFNNEEEALKWLKEN